MEGQIEVEAEGGKMLRLQRGEKQKTKQILTQQKRETGRRLEDVEAVEKRETVKDNDAAQRKVTEERGDFEVTEGTHESNQREMLGHQKR